MKFIHIPTLIFHGLLLILARLMMNDYADAFLIIAAIALAAHLVWCCCGKGNIAPSHLLGCCIQALVFRLGIITADSGFMGLGGGEFAFFFYNIALLLSAPLELAVGFFRFRTKK